MLSSISGQTDRWAQLAAMQDSPLIPSSQSNAGGSGTTSTPAANATAVTPITASGSTPLSSDTGLMLLMFGGPPNGANSAGANGANTASQTSAAAGAQGGFGSLLSQLQSLVSSLTGNSSTTSGSTGSIAAASTAASAGTTSGSTTTAIDNSGSLDGALLQGLNGINSDAGTVAAPFGGTQATPPPRGTATSAGDANSGSSGQPSSEDTAIANTHSAWADRTWGDGPSGAGGGWQQSQIATYLSQSQTGLDSATASATQSVFA